MSTPADGHNLLDPPLPYRLTERAEQASKDVRLQQFVNDATERRDHARTAALRDAFGDATDDVRKLAGRIKQHTLDHLDAYVEQFVDRATAAGATVHFATDAAEARDICCRIAKTRGSRKCVKSKSMVTEEIQLVAALEACGVETVETDLGEFIVQLDHDAPSHIVAPIIHKDRTDVARVFTRELGVDYTEDPATLTRIAREHLRRIYQTADMGISGGNFLVAETGSVVICTNEGNADLSVSGPPAHIAVVGIEKLVPRRDHLAVLLKVLARSATAQALTVYTTLVTGPRRPMDHDGPEAVHIVLVDNGRTEILREETRELLRCIRCGACLNACPVYRKLGGGHAYGAVYSGPIGAVITPLFKGLENYRDLPQASSLCGACGEACPVHIDIPAHLVRLRRTMVERGVIGRTERWLMRLWARSMRSERGYRLGLTMARLSLRALAFRSPARGWIRRAPPPLSGWTAHRDLPAPAPRPFRAWWRAHEKERRHDHRT